MLSKKMADSLSKQLNKELYSAYLYLSMALYATYNGLNGVANWMYVQVKEELTHVEKFYMYGNQQGGRMILKTIEQPPVNFTSVMDLFKKTLAHEQAVTGLINNLVNQARVEKDHATEAFLQWFVIEQVEEESAPTEILQKLKLVGNDGNGLLLIDSQLATRVFTPPQAGKV